MFPPREPRPEHGKAASARLGRARAVARRPLLAALAAAAFALPLAACGRDEPDLSNGKALFTQKCGSCHALARAGTQGQTGPNLDAAFRAALAVGMDRETVEGIVHKQILHPRRNSAMPAGLVKGADAEDVAAYVAFAAQRAGRGPGRAGAGRPGRGDHRRADLHRRRLRGLPRALQGRRERQHRPQPRRPRLVRRHPGLPRGVRQPVAARPGRDGRRAASRPA